MPTKIQVILVPYDSGQRGVRMGTGPEHFINRGLAQVLEADGHEVSVETIEAQAEFRAEVQTQFELYKSVAEHVAEAKRNGYFPLVLSGNCGATLGVIAGARTKQLGVVWFDAHGEFNTPETTTSGFLDGMGLAIATGLCWKRLAASLPNFNPLSGNQILHLGGRDFDEGERVRLEQTGVKVVDAAAIAQMSVRGALHSAITNLQNSVEEIHLHLDLDVLNPKEAVANQYATGEEGLRVEQVLEAIQILKEHLKLTSATVASFDSGYDAQGKTLQAGVKMIQQVLDSK